MGNDIKKAGLYGKDGLFQSDNPVIIESLNNLSIISISISELHAGVITNQGILYTWGTGEQGELGELSKTTSKPSIVISSCIFKSKQVVCGKQYTAICTEAGFLYIYSKGKSCKICGAVNTFPYTYDTLQSYYIDKIYRFSDNLIALSDTGKCFILENCFCLKLLQSNEKIEQIATCKNGIIGLIKEQNNFYM